MPNGYYINFHKNEIDKYISVNTFKNHLDRSKSNCFELMNLYLDLDIKSSDYLKKKYEKINHLIIFKEIDIICKKENIPFPTKINFSGSGYHIFWKIKEVNEKNESGKKLFGATAGDKRIVRLYEKIMNELINIFEILGADRNCKDVSRVLRKVNTVNSKSNKLCLNVFDSDRKVFLKDLANIVYDYSYEEVLLYKNQKATKKQQIQANKLNITITDNKFIARKEIAEAIKCNKKPLLQTIEHKSKNNWMLKHLNRILDNDLIHGKRDNEPGNRNKFIYLYGIACNKAHINKINANKLMNETFDQLNIEKEKVEEYKNTFASGYNVKSINVNTYMTINKQLGLDGRKVPKKRKKPTNRSTKIKINNIYYKLEKQAKIILLKQNNKYLISSRSLAKKYNISKDTIIKLRKQLEVSINEKNNLKSTINTDFFSNDIYNIIYVSDLYLSKHEEFD